MKSDGGIDLHLVLLYCPLCATEDAASAKVMYIESNTSRVPEIDTQSNHLGLSMVSQPHSPTFLLSGLYLNALGSIDAHGVSSSTERLPNGSVPARVLQTKCRKSSSRN